MKKLTLTLLIAVAGLVAIAAGPSVYAASAGKKDAAVSPDAPAAVAKRFASPEEAVKALKAAAEADDLVALKEIFGPDTKEIISGDKVQDDSEIASFTKIIKESCELSKQGDDRIILNLGADNWPFPIPLVKEKGDQWFFDTLAGREEIVNRRVGDNELNTIKICRAYIDAQREYAGADRDGSEVLKYAQKVRSTPGKKDGLFWETTGNEEQSPAGPLMATATAEGYGKKKEGSEPQPYHGYFFKILKAQGAAAPGGAYNYVINGNMIGGFALVAWPAVFGQSGVMTFIVSHTGKVYQKSLGPGTDEAARAMTVYNPDKSWTLVGEPAPAPGPAK